MNKMIHDLKTYTYKIVVVTSILTNKLRNMQKKYWGGKSASLMRQ